MIGARVAGYRLVSPLGTGATGVVYRAEHVETGRAAVVRILGAAATADRRSLARFWADARAAGQLRHPNLSEVWDLGQQKTDEALVDAALIPGRGPVVFVVAEWSSGVTLARRLEGQRRFEASHAAQLLIQATRGLGAAHERGLVHGNLKPSNLFLSRANERSELLKVLDFGTAHLSGARRRRAADPQVARTDAYLAPEQCGRDGKASPRSDVYALSAVGFEMLTGKRPTSAPSPEGPLRPGARGSGKAPQPGGPHGLGGLAAVLVRGLSMRPEDRFGSMTELRAALEEALAARPPALVAPALRSRARAAGGDPRERTQSRRLSRRLREIVERRLGGDRLRLPSLPGTATRALERLSVPSAGAASVAEVIEEDPLLVCRLLRMVNRGAIPPETRAATVQAVIARAGLDAMRSVLDELVSEQVVPSCNPGIRDAFRMVWAHGLAVGQLARELAVRLGGRVSPDEAHMAGLLHDVGKPIVAVLLLEVEHMQRKPGGDVVASWIDERVFARVIAESHTLIGTQVAHAFALPAPIAACIEGLPAYDVAAGAGSLPNLVRYANALAEQERLDLGPFDAEETISVLVQGRAVLGIDHAMEARLVSAVRGRVWKLTHACSAAGQRVGHGGG